MLPAQSLRLRARKKSGDLTTAIVPAGTFFPAVLREFLWYRYCSLRATATVAFRSPLRLASLMPQAFSADLVLRWKPSSLQSIAPKAGESVVPKAGDTQTLRELKK